MIQRQHMGLVHAEIELLNEPVMAMRELGI